MRIIYIVVGCLSLGLGAIGVVLPILPTTPFLLVSAFCFARGSERLNQWFLSTKLYEKHLDSFVQRRTMAVKTKATILITVTALMGFGFLMMGRVPVARAILAVVWICHVWYFVFRVKTAK